MTAELSRAAVLAYRARAQGLEDLAATPAGCGVLEVGVQDTPPGTTARAALDARLAAPLEQELALLPGLALVHSLRGAMHVHREVDLGVLTAALRPDDAEQAAALGTVARAMRSALADAETLTKGELSGRVTGLLPPSLHPWCQSCRVEHVPDGLFRAATLPVGLRLHPTGRRSAVFLRGEDPDPPAAGDARRELVRRFLRRCGPATPSDLAAWAGIEPRDARRWWALIEGQLCAVRVDGRRLSMHADDLAAARDGGPVTAVRLLPAYDPLTEVARRDLLLPDPAHRRQVWRAVANPGVLLVAGELTGTWRRRGAVVTVTPFRVLSDVERRAVQAAAAVQVVFGP